MKIAVTTAILVSVLASSAFAQSNTPTSDTPVIDQRLDNQQNRINQGLASGQMTQQEATKAENQDNRIAATDAKDAEQNGGNLTNKERRAEKRRLNRDSRVIYRKKHNNNIANGVASQ